MDEVVVGNTSKTIINPEEGQSDGIKRAKLNKKAFLFIGLAILIVLVVLIIILISKDKSKINDSKIEGYLTSNNCSQAALKSVSNEKPNSKNIKASIDLLSFRGVCLTHRGNYNLANVSYNQLRKYYLLENDKVSAASVSQLISLNNYASQHNGQPLVNQKPEISSAQLKAINSLNGVTK